MSCLAVGDVCNKGRKSLIVLTTAGWIHVFDVHADVNWPRASKSRSSSFSAAIRTSRSASNTAVAGGGAGGVGNKTSEKGERS